MSGGGSFQDLLGEYEAPTDYDIVLPGKVGEAAGNKGGANTPSSPAATTPAGTPAESHPAGTSQEPAPELPEGSDEDEASVAAASADEERVAEELQQAQETAQQEAEAETAVEETVGPDETDSEAEPVEIVLAPAVQDKPYPVIPRKGGSLTFDSPSVNLKYFPRVLVEEMREILKPHLGEEFAKDLSQFSLVTAFVIAAMGADLTTDEYTAHAVRAFRANDPKADVIEKRTAALLEQQSKTEAMLKEIGDKLGAVADTSAVLEMGQAYALAERTALLDTTGVMPESIDVTQKRAVASRDNIRTRVKKLQSEEKVRNGRPIR